MSSSAAGKMSWECFKALLSEELMVDEKELVPEASFIRDLRVDSIRMVELLLRMDELGLTIPPENAWKIQTVGDAYAFFARDGHEARK